MLSELQRTTVWEGWLGAEIRANYFADMRGHYQAQQKWFTWMILISSSGAAATLITDWLPRNWQWVKPVLALVTAALSFLLLLQQNQKRSTECADLHFRWSKLANKYKALWDDMYSPDALNTVRGLEEEEVELSKGGIGMPNNEKSMLKWENHVLRQHHLAPVA